MFAVRGTVLREFMPVSAIAPGTLLASLDLVDASLVAQVADVHRRVHRRLPVDVRPGYGSPRVR
eukprot:354230-Heterocapsa_arctica.AAC.1